MVTARGARRPPALFPPLRRPASWTKANPARDSALGASLIGYTLPLFVAIYNAQSLLDCVVWGLVALVVQMLIYWGMRFVLPDLSVRIERGERAAAILLAAASLAGGLINAASMTY